MFIVWPTREPTHKGMLVNVDTETETTFNIETGSEVTVRVSEMLNENGFAWEEPAVADFTCLTVADADFEAFQTGYKQYLLNAGTVACTETFTLMRA